MPYIRRDPAFKIKNIIFLVSDIFLPFSCVNDSNLYALSQISLLAQMIQNILKIEFNFGENLRIRIKMNHCAGTGRAAYRLDFRQRLSALIFLNPNFSLFFYSRLNINRERVDHGKAYAVQAAGHFVSAAAEFS